MMFKKYFMEIDNMIHLLNLNTTTSCILEIYNDIHRIKV